uniref:Protein TsetseEP domain-containing protein n=1 Tax=Clastoptera arizonana TaxID=38151 RepID=A0A1B6DRX0_9HEMI
MASKIYFTILTVFITLCFNHSHGQQNFAVFGTAINEAFTQLPNIMNQAVTVGTNAEEVSSAAQTALQGVTFNLGRVSGQISPFINNATNSLRGMLTMPNTSVSARNCIFQALGNLNSVISRATPRFSSCSNVAVNAIRPFVTQFSNFGFNYFNTIKNTVVPIFSCGISLNSQTCVQNIVSGLSNSVTKEATRVTSVGDSLPAAVSAFNQCTTAAFDAVQTTVDDIVANFNTCANGR